MKKLNVVSYEELYKQFQAPLAEGESRTVIINLESKGEGKSLNTDLPFSKIMYLPVQPLIDLKSVLQFIGR